MLKNYIKVATRALLRNKAFYAINIIGLSLGLTGFIYITLFIHSEYSFDRYHPKTEDIYRLVLGPLDRNEYTYAMTPAAMTPVLQQEYPGIKSFTRFRKFPSLVSFEEKMFYENDFYFTDSTVFDVFDLQLIEGNARTALVDPNSIVLTTSNAEKIFGTATNHLGKILTIDNELSYKITGIIEDLPRNSHFLFDYLVSLSSIATHHNEPLRTYQMTSWYAHYFYTYVRLNDGTNALNLDRQLRDAAKYHSNPENYELYGRNMGIFLQPLNEIHLNPIRGEIRPQGSQEILYVLGVVAVIILLLGCFNYANLTTAQSLKRSKEVGLRKTLGAVKIQLIQQFMLESIMITLVALAIALTSIQFTLPLFNNQFSSNLNLWSSDNYILLVFVLSCSLLTGILGGFYPSLVISSYKPISILRGVERKAKGVDYRKFIVLVQFTVSMILISATFVIYKQVEFMRSSELGITTDQIMVIPTNGNANIISQFTQFKERLQTLPQVTQTTISELTPGDSFGGIVARFEGMDKNKSFPTTGVSFDYVKTFGLEIIAGRDFDQKRETDSIERVIINKTLVNQLGWTPQEAVDKSYDFGGDNITPGKVIGVIEDYHFNSLKSPIFPIVLAIQPNFFDKISIRMTSNQLAFNASEIQKIWEEIFPAWPFEYYFADDHFDKQYKSEEQFGGLILSFSVIAIIIGGLGLLGIVLINTRHRLKEICIRKHWEQV